MLTLFLYYLNVRILKYFPSLQIGSRKPRVEIMLIMHRQFLSRVSMPMHAERDIAMTNLSVCLSVTLWYYIETNAQYRKTLSTYGRGMPLVF